MLAFCVPTAGRRAPAALPAVVLAAAVLSPPPANAAEAERWQQLFNGRDLEGWTVKIAGHEAGDNFADTFTVENGVLRADCSGYGEFGGRFGHLFYRRSFARYRLRVEYRFVGEQCPGGPEWGYRNSGVMIHGQTVASMTRDQQFPVSIEVQFLGGDGSGPRPTANVCTPGTHVVVDGRLEERHCIESSAPTFDGDRWVTVEVEVLGHESIRHRIGGRTVLAYNRPQLDDGTPLAEGTISLQAESHPVQFRRVELLVLDQP